MFVALHGEPYLLGRAVDQRGTSGQAASTRLKKRHPPPSESQRHLSLSRPRTLNVTRPAERMETQQRGAGRIGGADREEVEMTSEQQPRSAKRRLTVAADRATYSSLIEKRPARSGPKDCLEQSP
jgi:hypothetical protein